MHWELAKGGTLRDAVLRAIPQLRGAYGTVIMDSRDPSTLLAARSGSPMVIGLGMGENFIASDQLALLPVTRRFIFTEEGRHCRGDTSQRDRIRHERRAG